MKRKHWVLLAIIVVVLAAAWVVPDVVSDRAGASLNRTLDSGPYEVSQEALSVHRSLFVADLHADALLWNRDLRKRGAYGHVDLPRLREGGVALQVFGLVTKTPAGLNFERNTGDSDRITLLALAERWPPATWTSLYRRALYQARRLERLASSDPRVTLIRGRADLDALVERRAAGEDVLGVLLGLEGAHALEGDLGHLQGLYDAGLRMLGLAHFFDTEVSGSAHGVDKGGLTELGRRVVAESERLGIVVDLAHSSPATLSDVVALATKPVVVSHSGVRGTCGGPRNLTDRQLEAVAATGGVVGIALFPGAVCGDDVAATVAAIEYAAGVVGVDHVALGTDFDGAVTAPIDSSGLALVTEGLLERGFTRHEVAKIIGGNAVRVLRQTLDGGRE